MQKIKRKFAKFQVLAARKLRPKSYMKMYNKYLKIAGVHLNGTVKFIHPSVHLDTGYAENLYLGDNFVVSINSVILAHDYSLECGMASIGLGDLKNEKKIVKDVHIGNNVFIGAGCIILPGTEIGDNCIIGAGVVCSGKIPENSVIVSEKYKILSKTTEWIQKKINTIDS